MFGPGHQVPVQSGVHQRQMMMPSNFQQGINPKFQQGFPTNPSLMPPGGLFGPRQGIKRTGNKRHGKWTQEEETYANKLIEAFKTGAIEDCEDGCTLRSFLATKLQCAPMRISKKYVSG